MPSRAPSKAQNSRFSNSQAGTVSGEQANLGLSLAITGQAQESIKTLEPISSGAQADGRVRQNLAFAYAMGGDMTNALQVSRRDLQEAYAQRQLAYFMTLKSLPVDARSAEIRRNPNFFSQGARGG